MTSLAYPGERLDANTKRASLERRRPFALAGRSGMGRRAGRMLCLKLSENFIVKKSKTEGNQVKRNLKGVIAVRQERKGMKGWRPKGWVKNTDPSFEAGASAMVGALRREGWRTEDEISDQTLSRRAINDMMEVGNIWKGVWVFIPDGDGEWERKGQGKKYRADSTEGIGRLLSDVGKTVIIPRIDPLKVDEKAEYQLGEVRLDKDGVPHTYVKARGGLVGHD